MSKKDKIKEKIGILKEEYKNFFIVFMTLATASFTAFYQVVLATVPLWIALIEKMGQFPPSLTLNNQIHRFKNFSPMLADALNRLCRLFGRIRNADSFHL